MVQLDPRDTHGCCNLDSCVKGCLVSCFADSKELLSYRLIFYAVLGAYKCDREQLERQGGNPFQLVSTKGA